MTKQSRRKFTAVFKAKVAVEAIKNQKTLAELSTHFEVSSAMISKWKSEFLDNMSSVFEKDNMKKNQENIDVEMLYSQIGQLKVENDFLKKSCRKLGI